MKIAETLASFGLDTIFGKMVFLVMAIVGHLGGILARFFLPNTSIEVVLEMFFFFSNADF